MNKNHTLVVIPARAGSKGIPGKNHKLLNGKPLIAYSIEAALEVFSPEMICITTNDAEVIKIAESYQLQVPFVRPENLSDDTSSSRDFLLHAIEWYEKNRFKPNKIILLQPTSPFRKANQIVEALSLYEPSLDMVVSVKESKANPYFNLLEANEKGFLEKSKKGNFTRRQDCPNVYAINGAIYVINTQSLKENSISDFEKVIPYLMNEEDSLDLDTLRDWEFAEYLLNNGSST